MNKSWFLLCFFIFVTSCGGGGGNGDNGHVPADAEVSTRDSTYSTFCHNNGNQCNTLDVVAFEGSIVALLIDKADYDFHSYDHSTLEKMVAILDDAYIEYELVTGRIPDTHIRHIADDGQVRAPIAIIPSDTMGCNGYACGYLGATGIELGSEWFFNDLYEPFRNYSEFATVLFYEMGRNYWFYYDGLTGVRDDGTDIGFTTGYAVYMRDVIGERLELTLKPSDVQTGASIAQSFVSYMSDSSRNWENTFLAGDYPDGNDMRIDNNAFVAGMFKAMEAELGDEFVENFWTSVGEQSSVLPDRNDRLIENLFKAASDSVSRNLYTEFTTLWKLPTPEDAENYVPNNS